MPIPGIQRHFILCVDLRRLKHELFLGWFAGLQDVLRNPPVSSPRSDGTSNPRQPGKWRLRWRCCGHLECGHCTVCHAIWYAAN
mmetsp:Transcript_5874/g.19484  ORF Transcript_5874/g.19484 Transcript_5874/m.19484 type:complete len:84 (-) Transcript_5874:617-868(-)